MVRHVSGDTSGLDAGKLQTVLERLRAASLLMREIEAYLRGYGLSQTQFLAMMMIRREVDRDSLTASEIADRLDVSRPVMTRTMTGLKKAGLIEPAHAQPADQRQTLYQLSPAGQALFAQLLPGYWQVLLAAEL